MRTFDMKGSEFDREVLAKKPKADLTKTTLKDIDFFKTEEKIWIKPALAEGIINWIYTPVILSALIDDANFFKSVGLIDYSLLVFKVNWEKYCNEKQIPLKIIRERVNSSVLMVESIKEKGVF